MNFEQWLERQEARLRYLSDDDLNAEYQASDSERYSQVIIRETFRREALHMGLDQIVAKTVENTPFGRYCAVALEQAWDAWKEEQE